MAVLCDENRKFLHLYELKCKNEGSNTEYSNLVFIDIGA